MMLPHKASKYIHVQYRGYTGEAEFIYGKGGNDGIIYLFLDMAYWFLLTFEMFGTAHKFNTRKQGDATG